MRPCLISAWRSQAARARNAAGRARGAQQTRRRRRAARAERDGGGGRGEESDAAAMAHRGALRCSCAHRSTPPHPGPTGQCRRGRSGPSSPARGSAPWRALRHARTRRTTTADSATDSPSRARRWLEAASRLRRARTLELGLAEAHGRRRAALHSRAHRRDRRVASGGDDERKHLSAVLFSGLPDSGGGDDARGQRGRRGTQGHRGHQAGRRSANGAGGRARERAAARGRLSAIDGWHLGAWAQRALGRWSV